MTIDEGARLHLYEQARNSWGDAAADTLMSTIPRDPDRTATKDDLTVLAANVRAELTTLRADLTGEIGTLRGDMGVKQSELLRTLFFGMVASNATLVGLVFAAVRLG